MITSKASKRLYIIRVLKRSGMPSEDLISIYIALVRSILEYCCPVWHSNLTAYLKDQVERIKKRALRIFFPRLSYNDALSVSNIPRLENRKQDICLKLFGKIKSENNNKLISLVPSTRHEEHGLIEPS